MSNSATIPNNITAALAAPNINPRPFLLELVGQKISIQLKWNMEYQGTLISVDSYMNLQLSQAEEYNQGELVGFLGDIVIRCNNVLWIRAISSSDNVISAAIQD